MPPKSTCHSCSMPIESGTLCQHCSNEDGKLLPFAESFERFVQWTTKNEANVSRQDAERKTLEFMSSMPAWAEHPELVERRTTS